MIASLILSLWPLLAPAFQDNAAADKPTVYFKMTIYVFEGGQEPLTQAEPLPELVTSALKQVGRFMGYQGFRQVDQISWMVQTGEDMDRFLDIPEKWWSLAEDTNISFKLVYNYEARFLSLNDFRFMINQIPKLHTSAGLAHGEAAVLGHSKLNDQSNDLFFIVTLHVQNQPFEGQHKDAVFTVSGFHHEHK